MINDNSKIGEIYQEMALTDMKKIGKWDDKKNRHGYDKSSVGILTSPSGLKKLEDTFNRIGSWDFNLYFVKLPNVWKVSERGKTDPEDVKRLIGVEPGKDFPLPEDNQITVIFTNNTAAERVPLTVWTIAHRIGHAFSATFRISGSKETAYYDREISNTLRHLLECYGILPDERNLKISDAPYLRELFQSLGKFRSARMGKLLRPTEFYHEAFAYWLLNDGELDLNGPPKYIMSDNRKAWGTPTGRKYVLQDESSAEMYVEQLKYDLESLFHYLVGRHLGSISIM
jgi:hypothetical protein